MFLVDKYVPKDESDFIFNRDIVKQFEFISKDSSMPHLLILGPNGSGKKTLIRYLLNQMYDSSVEKLTRTKCKVTGSSNKTEDVDIIMSPHHIMIEPNANNYDKYIIQNIVQEYAKYYSIDLFDTQKSFKTIIIKGIDHLSRPAQASLRRTMEIYAETCRFIMIGTSLSKIIEPLHWRCSIITVKSPSNIDIYKTLFCISAYEKIKIEPEELCDIIIDSNRNVKKAIWKLSLYKYGLDQSTSLDLTIDKIANYLLKINENNYIKNFFKIRVITYDLMVTNITCSNIIRDIVNVLLKKTNDDDLRFAIIENVAEIENRLPGARRPVYHFEKFYTSIIKFILIKKK